MRSGRTFSVRSAGAAVLAAAGLASSCGYSCTDEGCSSGLFLSASFEAGAPPSSIQFCRASDCVTCRLGGAAQTPASCPGITLSVSPGDAGTARLDISSSKPPFDDGESLAVVVKSSGGATLLDWKGTALYQRVTVGGPNCDHPGHCASLSRVIP